MAGPTSFAPIIETAIGIVDGSRGQYHVLLIIADGQVCHLCWKHFPNACYLHFPFTEMKDRKIKMNFNAFSL